MSDLRRRCARKGGVRHGLSACLLQGTCHSATMIILPPLSMYNVHVITCHRAAGMPTSRKRSRCKEWLRTSLAHKKVWLVAGALHWAICDWIALELHATVSTHNLTHIISFRMCDTGGRSDRKRAAGRPCSSFAL